MEIKNVIALIIGAIVLIGIIIYLLINQREKVIEWLKGAVVRAEKLLGEKTGQLKLRQVYDWYVEKFPILAAVVPFTVFSDWVDIALETMNYWLSKNKQVVNYVRGEIDEGDTEEQSESLQW